MNWGLITKSDGQCRLASWRQPGTSTTRCPFWALYYYFFFNYFSKAGNFPVLYIQKKTKKNIINFIYRICIKPSFSSYYILALLNVIQKLLIVFLITSLKLRNSISRQMESKSTSWNYFYEDHFWSFEFYEPMNVHCTCDLFEKKKSEPRRLLVRWLVGVQNKINETLCSFTTMIKILR